MKPIYLYHLTQNGRIRYVGVTNDIVRRKSSHKRERPPHTFEIIDTFMNKEEAGIAEQYHIAGYKTLKNGWNRSKGGELLLSGENHPSWIDGRYNLDKKAYRKAYNQLPEVKAKKKEYRERPEVKAKRKEYMKAYYEKNIEAYKLTPEQKVKYNEYQKEYRARKKALANG
jgi:predicted GIY-YIG superfamily endonuclease